MRGVEFILPTSIFTNKKQTSFDSPWARTNNTFSGCDMVVTITVKTSAGTISQYLGSLQTISVSTSQNKIPVRCLGDINAKDYVDGPRTIAGSLVFTVFDQHWSTDLRNKLVDLGIYTNRHTIADELPPFDVTINFENEYGYGSYMAIKGIRIINEGQTMSINDIYTENTYQYVAMDIDYMRSFYYINGDSDDMKDNIGDDSSLLKDTSKPLETIPTESEPETKPTPTVTPKLDDDFSYSKIIPNLYSSLDSYKAALLKQKNIYMDKANSLYNKYDTDQKPKYDALVQQINSTYATRLKSGILYFKK